MSLFWFCVFFIFGIGFASFFNIFAEILAGFFILAVILIFAGLFLRKELLLWGICLLALLAGIFCYQQRAGEIEKSQLLKLSHAKQEISLVVIVDSNPDIGEKSRQFVVRSENSKKEKFLAVTEKYPEYRYGDRLKITGVLKIPENFAAFDYRNYLAKEGIYTTMVFPKIEFLDSNQGNPIKATLYSFENRFRETWRQLLSPPHLGIFEALTFGEESNISQEWKEKLNFAGIRHLTAVSGMNIAVP